MKLNKRILKDIVKECLVEILAEGLVSGNSSAVDKRLSLHESIKNTTNTTQKRSTGKDSTKRQISRSKSQGHLDSISFGQSNKSKEQDTPKRFQLTNDPIMNEIFADTAATTLKEQASSESRRGPVTSARSDTAARVVDAAPLEDIFGQASENWASLAFAPTIRNK
jgi:hypothetical protein